MSFDYNGERGESPESLLCDAPSCCSTWAKEVVVRDCGWVDFSPWQVQLANASKCSRGFLAKDHCTRGGGYPESRIEDLRGTLLVPAFAGTMGFCKIPTAAFARIRELHLPWAKIYPSAFADYNSFCLS